MSFNNELGTPRTTSVRMSSMWAEIRSRYIPYTEQDW